MRKATEALDDPAVVSRALGACLPCELLREWGVQRESLDSQDIRALLRLLAELRELGGDPDAWRGHLARRLEELCDAPVSLVIELKRHDVTPVLDDKPSCSDFVSPLHAVSHGLDAGARERFYREVYFTDHSTDDALGGVVPLYGTAFTVRRGDVVSDRMWNRSFSANERWRANGLDDFILSMVPVPELNVLSSIEVYRGRGRRFSERERSSPKQPARSS